MLQKYKNKLSKIDKIKQNECLIIYIKYNNYHKIGRASQEGESVFS